MSFIGCWAASSPPARNPAIISFARWIRRPYTRWWRLPQVVGLYRTAWHHARWPRIGRAPIYTFASYSIARQDADRRTNRLIRGGGRRFIALTYGARCTRLFSFMNSPVIAVDSRGTQTIQRSAHCTETVDTFWLHGFSVIVRIDRRQQ